MAQAFARLGSRVTLLELAPRLLPREDPEVSGQVKSVLETDGVQVHLNAAVRRASAEADADGSVEHTLSFDGDGTRGTVSGDALLVAAGRLPNVEGLGLERAGVKFTPQGIVMDTRCRTTARNIYACGDVTGQFAFTHVAEHQAKVAVANAVLRLPMKLDYRAVPWAIFTEPEVARVGMTEPEARRQQSGVKVYRVRFGSEDRAITDDETTGFLKLIASRRGRKILGAHIVGPRAGELILEFVLAMQHGISPAKLSATIHPYPTFSLAGRHAADIYWLEKSTGNLARWVQRIFGYSGAIAERYRGEDDGDGGR
jgi:pyruvate/2-oxoglutarate dehydrogenase complex dihydrolipoamide dehydrogenase (E3) component